MDPGKALSAAKAVHGMLNGQSAVESEHPTRPDGHRIALPDFEPPRVDMVATLVQRRSHYTYADKPLQLDALSTLFRFALGVQRFVQAYGVEDHPLGMAPSAGGLRCLTAYAIVTSAAGLAPGVYRYESVSHELVEVTQEPPAEELAKAYLQPEFAARAPVTLALTTRLDLAFAKYPLRHYRTLHVDAGIAVQNLYLIATALKLAGCAVAGFDDNVLSELLKLPDAEIPTMLFAVGHAV
ncbi:SagB family peptide dehydrogenase [Amycolatopsis suaedae]|uniref:SagB/ThcOx family dehydrogenase n=1 Tax=Amycolatopsis suaedae TaxID=2510978 RepID=A0A4Q7JDK6_9PSEU|nr:SagB family peptide dehydrogenase [Amycolatopsis suaedae]RZQ64723.1 SagB/ThcOx family dehydrogenase [Amycolatopsis suaedae]